MDTKFQNRFGHHPIVFFCDLLPTTVPPDTLGLAQLIHPHWIQVDLILIYIKKVAYTNLICNLHWIKTACGGNFGGKSGVLTSPNYPNNYGTDFLTCDYVISVAASKIVYLNFTSFDTEPNRDFIEVIDSDIM